MAAMMVGMLFFKLIKYICSFFRHRGTRSTGRFPAQPVPENTLTHTTPGQPTHQALLAADGKNVRLA